MYFFKLNFTLRLTLKPLQDKTFIVNDWKEKIENSGLGCEQGKDSKKKKKKQIEEAQKYGDEARRIWNHISLETILL